MFSMIYEKNRICTGNFQETILCGSGFGGGFTRGQISVGGSFLGFLSNPVNFWSGLFFGPSIRVSKSHNYGIIGLTKRTR